VRERFEREFYLELNENHIILDLKRSGKYFKFIERKLKEKGLPDDLKFLAVAESRLNERAYSKMGAAGIWQLMPETARRYGLRVDEYIDERLNFYKSTEAALEYLKDLYKMFGSWMLALAAYNAGERRIRENLEFQWVDNYFDLYLNQETARFIFRIATFKELISNAKRYGIYVDSTNMFKPPSVKYVMVRGPIDNLALWAKSWGTNYKTVKYLNPWILRSHLPEGYYLVALPKDARPRKIDTSNYKGSSSREKMIVHIVKKGETLYSIARRYNVDIYDIISLNGIQRNIIFPGQRLKIPVDY
jgi:hypothetical protein